MDDDKAAFAAGGASRDVSYEKYTDEEIMEQDRLIREAIAKSQPLFGDLKPVSTLQDEYKDNRAFLVKLPRLGETYSYMRSTRGDGSCFYRAFLFSWAEGVLRGGSGVSGAVGDERELSRVLQAVIASREMLGKLGYAEFVVEPFWETLVEFLQDIGVHMGQQSGGGAQHQHQPQHSPDRGASAAAESKVKDDSSGGAAASRRVWTEDASSQLLLSRLGGDAMYCSYIVTFLRYLTSAEMQQHPERYAPFVAFHQGSASSAAAASGPQQKNSNGAAADVVQFCKSEVEPVNKEADQIQVIALSSALGVGVRIAYLDRSPGEQVVYHDFPEGTEPRVHLLYRPGHYDILYPA